MRGICVTPSRSRRAAQLLYDPCLDFDFVVRQYVASLEYLGGYCGQVSFGHSVFFGIGAYGAGLAVVIFNAAPWPGMLLGASVAAIVAILISWPVFKLSGHYFAIATFAIVEFFNRLFMVWYFKSPITGYQVGGALGLDYPLVDEGWKMFTWYESKTGYYYGALLLFILIFGIVRWIERHRFGYYLRAVREGQETAESLGVNSTVVKLTAMASQRFWPPCGGAFFVQYNFVLIPHGNVARYVHEIRVDYDSWRRRHLFGPCSERPSDSAARIYARLLGGLAAAWMLLFRLLIVLVVIKQHANHGNYHDIMHSISKTKRIIKRSH
jgi:branched-chain amino acid transport system permease protein